MKNKLKYLGEYVDSLNSEKIKELSSNVHNNKMFIEIFDIIGDACTTFGENYKSTNDGHIGVIYNVLMVSHNFDKLAQIHKKIKNIICKYHKDSIDSIDKLTKNEESIDIMHNKKNYDTIWLFIDGKITLSVIANPNDNDLLLTLTYQHFNYYSIIRSEEYLRIIEKQNIYRI